MLSLNPDPWMRWIYNNSDPRYHDPATRNLRERRDAALRSASLLALWDAEMSDLLRQKETRRSGLRGSNTPEEKQPPETRGSVYDI